MKNLNIGNTALALAFCAGVAGAVDDPLTYPLVQKGDLEYIGSFSMPQGPNGSSQFGYGGRAIIPYNDEQGRFTLYVHGNVQQSGHVAQIEVPAVLSKSKVYTELPKAKVLQNFAQIIDGSLSNRLGITSGDGASVYGLFPWKGKLLVAATEYYGCTQSLTHGTSALDLTATNDFAGFYRVTGLANARAIAGPMTEVPQPWRTLVGGSVLSGNFGVPLVSCTSAGPALTAFDPDQLGVSSPIQGNTLLFYSLSATYNNALCEGAQCSQQDPGAATSELYNYTTALGGMAFPDGTRSVLFFGRQGTGKYCYGTPDGCGGDPAEPDAKGPHAFPYRYQVWAYDVKDLLMVKSGVLKTYQPRPYAVWAVNDLDSWKPAGYAKITGAGYDNKTRRWFITTDYGEKPRVDVFQIKQLAVGVRKGETDRRFKSLKVQAMHDRLAKSVLLDVPGYSNLSNAPLRYRIFDNRGHMVGDIAASATDSKAVWNTEGHASGVYIVKSVAEGLNLVSRITLSGESK